MSSVRVVFDRIPAVAPGVARTTDQEIEASARRIQAGAMVRTPVVTGTLRRGWQAGPIKGGWEVRNDITYAPYIEWGTRYIAPRAMLTQAVAAEAPRLPAGITAAIRRDLR